LRARTTGLVTAVAVLSLAVGGGAVVVAKPAPRRVVVGKGETLSLIAAREKVPLNVVIWVNKLAHPDRLQPGQVLLLPPPSKGTPAKAAPAKSGPVAAKPAPKATPGFHIVRAGETVSSIAAKEKVSPGVLSIANGLLPGEPLFVGARLRLTMPPNIAKAPQVKGAGDGVHTVAKGESLATIADRYDTSVGDLVRRNKIKNANRVVQGMQLVVPGGGGFRCPVAGAKFVNDFGLPRGDGARFHQGNDMLAPRGTRAVAPVAGTVRQSVGSLGGKQFYLRGDDGNDYIGSHLDRFGATGHVDAGAVLGYVGDSGDALGGPTHLHFEIHPGRGEAINPYPILVAACRS
jgi:LysM repeat protein